MEIQGWKTVNKHMEVVSTQMHTETESGIVRL